MTKSKLYFLKSIIKKGKKNSFFSFLFKNIFYYCLRLLFATYRLRVTYHHGDKKNLKKQTGIFYFWHQQIISSMLFFSRIKAKGACVVSPSSDGKFAGFICQKLGFTPIYGSSYKEPISLLRQCISILKKTNHLCLVGDGSRGPAFQLQKGATYLSKKTGVPLIFIECKPNWKITLKKSWDHFQIPLPFSRINIIVHAPTSPQSHIT